MKSVLNIIAKSVVCTAVLSIASNVLANPISLSGIHLQMEVREIESILEERGFKCFEYEHDDISCEKGGKGIYIFADKSNTGGKTGVTPKMISFNCHNFNACSYSIKQVAQFLVDHGIVQEMFYDEGTLQDGSFMSRWCGVNESEKLCVIDFDNSNELRVFLMNMAPKGEMSFN